jgi:hypothetical protein
VVAGIGWFGLRAFRSISSRMAEEREHATPGGLLPPEEPTEPGVAPTDAGSARESARAECRAAMDAVDTNFDLKGASALCRKRLAEFGGDALLATMVKEVQCREWRDQVASGSNMAKELRGWIAKDCTGPDGAEIPANFVSLDQLKCRKFTVELDDLRHNKPVAAWLRLDHRDLEKCDYDIAAARAELKPLVIAESRKQCLAEAPEAPPGYETLRAGRTNAWARYALDGCRRYTSLSYCPELKELKIPKGKKLVLKGKLGTNGWRPKDPALVQLLNNQFLGVPVEGEWKCSMNTVSFFPSYDDPGYRRPRPTKPQEW